MKLKYLFVGFLISIGVSAQLSAQAGEGMLGEDLAAAVERLELREEQKVAVQEIMKEFAGKRRAVMEKHGIELGTGERPKLRELREAAPELREIRAAQEKRMGEVLDAEQMATLRELRKEGRAKVQDALKERRKKKE